MIKKNKEELVKSESLNNTFVQIWVEFSVVERIA